MKGLNQLSKNVLIKISSQLSIQVLKLTSITGINKVFQTGRSPLLVECNDLKDYVCKHVCSSSSKILLNEYLASSFLNIWKIPTPPFAFIKVKDEHINDECLDNGVQPIWLKTTCFGSLYLQYAKEIDGFFEGFSKKNLKKVNEYDFIKIALFDFWMANEDRIQNNPNLLLNYDNNRWIFYAIDHEACFNTNSGNPLYQLNEGDTILAHDLFKTLFKQRNTNYKQLLNDLFVEFTKNVDNCNSILDDILNSIPADWDVNIHAIKEFLIANIFSNKWKISTEKNFKYLFHKFIR